MALKFAITDLSGVQVAVPQQYSGALVTIPYNDSRTAEVTISANDEAAAQVLSLERMLKVWYIHPDESQVSYLVFWGPIIAPRWHAHTSEIPTLRIEAHDPSIRLKNHYLLAADTGIFTGAPDDPGLVPVGYEGLRMLRDAGDPTSGPILGIANGSNTHTGATAGRDLNVQKGDEVWQRWREIADDPFGPDFRLVPDDSVAGRYVRLDTFDKTETAPGGTRDKRDSVIFQFGFGVDNVEELEYAPAGSRVRNRAIAIEAHSNPDDPDKVAEAVNTTSLARFGEYVSYEAGGSNDNTLTESTLLGKAKAVLLAYAYPPQEFSFTPRSDERQRYIYGRDFLEGEVIFCSAHFGAGVKPWLPGLVTEVRLRQLTASGRTQTEIDAIPDTGDLGELS